MTSGCGALGDFPNRQYLFVVGWMIASLMKSKPVALLLADLGVTKTHSRPHVSDDNPYSESQFRTLKYRPGFPDRFGSIEDARGFSSPSFAGTTTNTTTPAWA